MSLSLAGQPYRFGPFQMTLPDGWSVEVVDGIHEMLPDQGDFALHISGYQKDDPVSAEDLAQMAASHGASDPANAPLPSGLDAITFDAINVDGGADAGDPQDMVDEDTAGPIRFWLIRHGTAMIAVTLTCDAQDLAAAALPAQMIVGSIRPAEED